MMFLDADGNTLTTGEIAEAFLGTPSIFSQMRRTFRSGDVWGANFVSKKIGSTVQFCYTLRLEE